MSARLIDIGRLRQNCHWFVVPRWLLVVLVLAAPVAAPIASEQLVGVASVIDGDTIEIHGTRIRLYGIDAPESTQLCQRQDRTRWRCGQQAALALQDHIGRSTVTCVKRDTDRYGRVVGQCTVGGADINAWLAANGWAVAYRHYAMDYVDEEQAARAAGIGIWSGAFVMPWDWRRGQRLETTMAAPADGCRIKANINRRGERIYHIPGGRDYDRTRIDESTGERWFCTEAEARAAGWRRSSQ
jgi:endonuclease YncB( thermonuclease family)